MLAVLWSLMALAIVVWLVALPVRASFRARSGGPFGPRGPLAH